MKRCETCKHWNQHPNLALGPLWGICKRGRTINGKLVDPETQMYALDGSDDYADTYTNIRFGCTMHEEKQG